MARAQKHTQRITTKEMEIVNSRSVNRDLSKQGKEILANSTEDMFDEFIQIN